MNRAQRRRGEVLQPKPLRRKQRWVPLQRATPFPMTAQQIAEQIAFGAKHGMTEDQVRATIEAQPAYQHSNELNRQNRL